MPGLQRTGLRAQARATIGETMKDTRTHAERLAEEIGDAILRAAILPGARLDEQSLAERYNVSRTPVREALRQLAATGLIEMRPRRGAIVSRMTSEYLNQLFVAMGEMEATCARLCALRMSPIERRRLQAQHETMGALQRMADTENYITENSTFHALIYAGAHNPPLAEIATGLRRRLEPFRRAQFRAPGRISKSHAEHDGVVAAILRGDAATAHTSMLHHVSLVEDAFEQVATPVRQVGAE